MAIKINGVTVIDNSRNVTDVENVGDTNTVYYGDGSNLTGVGGGITADLLVVGGGGGGANSSYSYPGGPGPSMSYTAGGGGGGGGVLVATNYTLNPGTTYTITIGAGAAGGYGGTDGSNTTVSNSSGITLLRGGYGGGGNLGFAIGNGGGRTQVNSGPNVNPGQPSVTPGPGIVPTPGGTVENYSFGSTSGNGAGAKQFASREAFESSITGANVGYGSGGKVGSAQYYYPYSTPINPFVGQANTGDGGSGGIGFYYQPPYPVSASHDGAAGGSGIVVIKYPTAFPAAPSYPGATKIASPTHHIYQFTSSGTITLG